MTGRRRRALSAEDRRLWAEVARSVLPLDAARMPPLPTAVPPAMEVVTPEIAAQSPAPAPPRPRPATKPALPPLAPLERTTLRALARGQRSVDAVLDLHGMRQAEAHLALNGFLRRAQSAGHGLVLVVTGKGGVGGGLASFGGDERGVLRRVVPHWLGLPDLRGIVLGFDEAVRHQGGEGALYVRLRRRRVPPLPDRDP